MVVEAAAVESHGAASGLGSLPPASDQREVIGQLIKAAPPTELGQTWLERERGVSE